MNMFDRYTICEEGFCNAAQDAQIAGFEILIRIAYYRGLRLSMVEGFDVTVDGESYPAEKNLFTTGGRTYTYEEMENEPTGRWEFGEKAVLFVPKPGGLTPGPHTIHVVQHLRISYSPSTVIGDDTKTLAISA
jgi:Domain of unknown function (DUF6379)